jgi:hypothetical protein
MTTELRFRLSDSVHGIVLRHQVNTNLHKVDVAFRPLTNESDPLKDLVTALNTEKDLLTRAQAILAGSPEPDSEIPPGDALMKLADILEESELQAALAAANRL